MPDARWHFREMSRGELNQNPMERELFAAETINERLVREAIQNSLDASIARLDKTVTTPVRVRFSLQGVHNPLNADSAALYLDGLDEHLKEGLDPNDDFRRRVAVRGLADSGMPYLVIEDTGTVGLEGDWERYDDSEDDPAENEHFYWFFRNIGRSGKLNDEGGSWGLGKWVFPDASHASSYIAVTRRHSDGEILLMGQTVLTKHNVDGQRYAPYGYFGEIDDGLAVPLHTSEPSHRAFIRQCINDFGLRFRDEPGLSIIVPFPRTDGDPPITEPEVLAAVIHNYFYPIIAGRLEVIVDEGNNSSISVTADTIDDVLSHLDLDDSGERSVGSYQRLFDICRSRAVRPEQPHVELRSAPVNRASYPHYSELTALRERYENGDLLAFRIWTTVERKEPNKRELTSFRLYVQHDNTLAQGHDFYVRGALSITKMDEILRHKARTLLVVDDDEPLAAMLRDSEPPAHTAWHPQSDRVTKAWVAPKRRIDEVRKSASVLLHLWEVAPVELQRDALADIFPLIGAGERRRQGSRKGEVAKRQGSLEISGGHPDFDVHRSSTGFRVRLTPSSSGPPKRVRLRVAYEVPRGNPMTSHSPHDFCLHGIGSLDVEADGCEVNAGGKSNELLLDVTDPAHFFIGVQGFDTHRDVLVRVERVAENTVADGGEE